MIAYMDRIIGKVEEREHIACIYFIFYMHNDNYYFCFPSALSNTTFSAILKLHETNHRQCVESLMMILTTMKLDLALRIPCPSKLIAKSFADVKKLYKEWEYLNHCRMMIIRYHMEDSICDSIPKV